MALHSNSSEPPRDGFFSDATWEHLYISLRPHAIRWVYSSTIISWRGQEEDVAEDIVQVGVIRTYTYAIDLEAEGTLLRSPEAMGYTIAHNYYNDLRRREGRIERIGSDGRYVEIAEIDLVDIAVEGMYVEWLIVRAAHEISQFPEKQRRAILIDLANLTDFEAAPTVLQQSLLSRGISLQDYQQPRYTDQVMRSRHASLVSTAYRRLRESHVELSSTNVA